MRVQKVMSKFVDKHLDPLVEDLSDPELQLKFEKGAVANLDEWKNLVTAHHCVAICC